LIGIAELDAEENVPKLNSHKRSGKDKSMSSGSRKTRHSTSDKSLKASRKICKYPLQVSGVTVTISDYLTLEKDFYLNDIIIDFYLAYLHHRKLDEDDQKRIFIFNSMFYKCLITDPEEDSKQAELESISNLTRSVKRHGRVKRWTNSQKLADKEIVCKFSHWILITVQLSKGKIALTVMDSIHGANMETVDDIIVYLSTELDFPRGKIEVCKPTVLKQGNGKYC
jgi:Ulp1 family protease